jgi:hypothetical protein
VLSSARRIPEGLKLLEEAIERDPNYALALAVAAVCFIRLRSEGSSKDPEGDLRKGVLPWMQAWVCQSTRGALREQFGSVVVDQSRALDKARISGRLIYSRNESARCWDVRPTEAE